MVKRIFLLLSLFLFSCAPETQISSQSPIVTVYATPAAGPWLTELYACADQQSVVLNVTPNNPQIYLQLGEPANLISPAYEIDEEEIWVVANRESQILNMGLDDLQSLFAGQGDPAIQIWVYAQGEDVQKVFDQFVMQGRSVTSTAHLAATPQDMVDLLESERQAVGILPLTWGMKMEGGSHGIYQVATVPVLAILQDEETETIRSLLDCLSK